MLKVKHVPEQLLDVTVTPVLFLLMFTYLFGGALVGSTNAVMNGGSMGLFPLIFLSNIFVDPRTLPSGLETFVGLNPVSHLVTAVRGLMAGTVSTNDI